MFSRGDDGPWPVILLILALILAVGLALDRRKLQNKLEDCQDKVVAQDIYIANMDRLKSMAEMLDTPLFTVPQPCKKHCWHNLSAKVRNVGAGGRYFGQYCCWCSNADMDRPQVFDKRSHGQFLGLGEGGE